MEKHLTIEDVKVGDVLEYTEDVMTYGDTSATSLRGDLWEVSDAGLDRERNVIVVETDEDDGTIRVKQGGVYVWTLPQFFIKLVDVNIGTKNTLAAPTLKGSVEKEDAVNSPSHYTTGNIEVIDYIEDKQLGYHLGNAVKYISRAGRKDVSKTEEDLQKAIWYIERQIKLFESGEKEGAWSDAELF